jgi:Cys/Met metabolism PLP-dependent enzyme
MSSWALSFFLPLNLRWLKQHGCNALAVARALEDSPGVEEVIYPGLPGKTEVSKRRHQMAWTSLSLHARRFIRQELGDGGDLHIPPSSGFPYSGMISFRIRGGLNEVDTFLTSTRLFSLAESLVVAEEEASTHYMFGLDSVLAFRCGCSPCCTLSCFGSRFIPSYRAYSAGSIFGRLSRR